MTYFNHSATITTRASPLIIIIIIIMLLLDLLLLFFPGYLKMVHGIQSFDSICFLLAKGRERGKLFWGKNRGEVEER